MLEDCCSINGAVKFDQAGDHPPFVNDEISLGITAMIGSITCIGKNISSPPQYVGYFTFSDILPPPNSVSVLVKYWLSLHSLCLLLFLQKV